VEHIVAVDQEDTGLAFSHTPTVPQEGSQLHWYHPQASLLP
jgi:hypothetical protein